jgi:hypothetical protein
VKRAVALCLLVAAGCSRATTPPVTIQADREFSVAGVRMLAVMPARPAPTAKELPPKALQSVTELLIDAAAHHGSWLLADPDKVLAAAKLNASVELAEAAVRVAKTVGADATLTALVSGFRERVGVEFGASEPASVSIQLVLVPAKEKKIVWKADYAITQEPLTYNLWNFWQVQRGGARWLTASELARIGIDEAVARLAGGERSR